MSSANPPQGSSIPQVQLSLREGPQSGKSYMLSQPAIILGRAAGNEVVIEDTQVSRRHASITWDGQQHVIQDLGSSNGTFVNGVRLTGPRVLQSGDSIGLGSTVVLSFQSTPFGYAAQPPAPSGMAYGPAPATPTPPKGGRFWLLLGLGVGALLLLVLAVGVAYYFLRQPPTQLVVFIDEPRSGAQVLVGEAVSVHTVARDESKVKRVELWADGQLVAAQSSSYPDGTLPLPLLALWQPGTPGNHTLIARAFGPGDKQAQASIYVEAVASSDRDGDGVSDDEDICPDEVGPMGAAGCPDGDADGIPDGQDACPDEAGLPEADGCPAPGEDDQDGDGVADSVDACPGEAGSPGADGCPDADGDGVPDSLDTCPSEPGFQEDGCPPADDMDGDGVPDALDACPEEAGEGEDGCPIPEGPEGDTDGDGILDAADACPFDPGPPETNGCPDTDGDGVPDISDLCPTIPGDPANAGCPPPPGSEDSDGDGILDSVDLCTLVPGPPEYGGCPPPPEDPPPPDPDPWPLWPPPWGIDPGILDFTGVEFEALTLDTASGDDYLSCYLGFGAMEKEQYVFAPLGGGEWDIAAQLGGTNSQYFLVLTGQPLELEMECAAIDVFLIPGGVDWDYWHLGTVDATHPPVEWDGHVITSESVGGDGGRSFEASYRLCAGSCEDAVFPPPMLTIYHDFSGYYLLWEWTGDTADIDGFRVYLNGSYIHALPDTFSALWLGADLPACGSGSLDYQVTAFRGGLESPPSNIAAFEPEGCPYTVRVTYETLTTRDLGSDEWWAIGEGRGPIYGEFRAVGATSEILAFDAADHGFWGWGDDEGFRLLDDHTYQVQDIFDWVHHQMSICWGPFCPDFSAPMGNSMEVEMGPDDDLTLSFVIRDQDTGPDGYICNAIRTLPSEDVTTRTFEYGCPTMSVEVLIEPLPMP